MEPNMHRMSLSIPPEELEKIERLSCTKGLTLSAYLRVLIRIGLVLEEAATPNNDDKGAKNLSTEDQILLWKTQLTWEKETGFLVRHLVDILTQASLKERDALFKNAREKADAKVSNLLPHFNSSGN